MPACLPAEATAGAGSGMGFAASLPWFTLRLHQGLAAELGQVN